VTNLSNDPRIAAYANEAAFPRPTQYREHRDEYEVLLAAQWGLTKRELFAAMAMQGLAGAYSDGGNFHEQHVAKGAVLLADALLSALEQTRG
jgi:hypothetical protein